MPLRQFAQCKLHTDVQTEGKIGFLWQSKFREYYSHLSNWQLPVFQKNLLPPPWSCSKSMTSTALTFMYSKSFNKILWYLHQFFSDMDECKKITSLPLSMAFTTQFLIKLMLFNDITWRFPIPDSPISNLICVWPCIINVGRVI